MRTQECLKIDNARTKTINTTRYSVPYIHVDTSAKSKDPEHSEKLTYFIDTGASESTITLPLLQKLGWTDFMSPSSKCKKLKGLIIEVNVIGRIELILSLKESEEKSPHEIKISHIFQIIESKILEASLSVIFFCRTI